MKGRLNIPDLVAGAIVMAIGAFFAVAGRGLAMGSARAMGLGYFPRLLAWLTLALGLAICGRAVIAAREPFPSLEARPILFVLASLCFFTAVVEPLGLVIAVTGAILLASLAAGERRLLETTALAVGAAGGAVLIFVMLLKLQFPVWPR